MKLLVKMLFGSHLYGTSNENSDTDYKGVYMPEPRDILLGRVKHTIETNTKNTKGEGVKNTKDDVDTSFHSLQYFIDLCCKGETLALDMLHAPEEYLIFRSGVWDNIVDNRKMFYTKNLKAFVGYARRQASKYGCKGGRIFDAKKVLEYCNLQIFKLGKDFIKLKDVWEALPNGEHIIKHEEVDKSGFRMYEVCNRKFPETCTLKYLHDGIKKFYDSYGDRARQAEFNEGIDFKAISHAFRAAYQTKEILETNDLKFPLQDAEFLKDIKEGKLHYKDDKIGEKLDNLIDEIEELSLKSNYPEKVDRKYWDDYLEYILEGQIVDRKYLEYYKEI